jgi:alkaline phosphatase D
MSGPWQSPLRSLAALVLAAAMPGASDLPGLANPIAPPAAAMAGEGTLMRDSDAAWPAEAAIRQAAAPPSLVITHGIASGDVTATSATVWARASGTAQLHVEYATDPLFAQLQTGPTVIVDETTDFTATVKLQGLAADTVYYYRVWFSGAAVDGRATQSQRQIGTFRTAPGATTSRPVSFIVGGDVGGQGYCRRPELGYATFAQMQALAPDFFVANGDLIYADGACPASGPGGWQNVPGDFPDVSEPAVDWTDLALVRDVMWKHWRYNRADSHLQNFLMRTPMYSQWDDHEVINDFGAPWTYWNADNVNRPGYPNLVTAGRDALFHYSPIDRNPVEPNRIYRSFNWGQDLDLFLLDARSYRSRNDLPDTPANDKTLLGREQIQWLKEGLQGSAATWKVVSIDSPLSLTAGSNTARFGYDSYANGTTPDFSAETGFERELLDLVRFLDDVNVNNLVFVVTDVHFAANVRHEIDANGDGDTLLFYELVSGPISAIRLDPTPDRFDPTLGSTVLYSEGGIFNFSYVRVQRAADGLVHLIADVRGEDGLPRLGSLLDLTPQ